MGNVGLGLPLMMLASSFLAGWPASARRSGQRPARRRRRPPFRRLRRRRASFLSNSPHRLPGARGRDVPERLRGDAAVFSESRQHPDRPLHSATDFSVTLTAAAEPPAPVLRPALHDSGFTTGFIGKWHMGNDPTPRPGFDFWVGMKGQGEAMIRAVPKRPARTHDRISHGPLHRARARVRRQAAFIRSSSCCLTRRCIRTCGSGPTAP